MYNSFIYSLLKTSKKSCLILYDMKHHFPFSLPHTPNANTRN